MVEVISWPLRAPKGAVATAFFVGCAFMAPTSPSAQNSICDYEQATGTCQVLPVPAVQGTYFQLGNNQQCASVDYAVAGRAKRIFLKQGRAEDKEASGPVQILGCVAYGMKAAPTPTVQMGAWSQQGQQVAMAPHVTQQMAAPTAVSATPVALARVRYDTTNVAVPVGGPVMIQTSQNLPLTTLTENKPTYVSPPSYTPPAPVVHTRSVQQVERVVKRPSKDTLGSADLVETTSYVSSSPSYVSNNLGVSETVYQAQPVAHQPVAQHNLSYVNGATQVARSNVAVASPVAQPQPRTVITKPQGITPKDFGACCSTGPLVLAPMSAAVEGEWCHDSIGPLSVKSDHLVMTRENGQRISAPYISRGAHSLTYYTKPLLPFTGLIAPTSNGFLLWRDKPLGGLFEKDYLMTRCESHRTT